MDGLSQHWRNVKSLIKLKDGRNGERNGNGITDFFGIVYQNASLFPTKIFLVYKSYGQPLKKNTGLM